MRLNSNYFETSNLNGTAAKKYHVCGIVLAIVPPYLCSRISFAHDE
jgi:hypothetical protein